MNERELVKDKIRETSESQHLHKDIGLFSVPLIPRVVTGGL